MFFGATRSKFFCFAALGAVVLTPGAFAVQIQDSAGDFVQVVSDMASGAGYFYDGGWSEDGKAHLYCHLNELFEARNSQFFILETPQFLCGRISYWADTIDKYVREECKKDGIPSTAGLRKCKAAKEFKGRFPKHFWNTGAFFKPKTDALAAKRVDALNKWLDTNAVASAEYWFKILKKYQQLSRGDKKRNVYFKALELAKAHREAEGKVSSWLKDKASSWLKGKAEFKPLTYSDLFSFKERSSIR